MNKKIDVNFDLRSFSKANLSLLPPRINPNFSIDVNLFDLLVMTGRLTTPAPQYPWDWRNLYAIFRYGWAISNNTNFQLIQDVKNVDFRLKALMSEDFGIGFTGIIMRDYFECHFAGATSTIFHNRPRNTAIRTRATPDFIGLKFNGTPLIFESKGTQTSIAHSNKQINDGKRNQVQLFQRFHNFPGFVVGSFLSRTGSTTKSCIKVMDPYEKTNLGYENSPLVGDILDSHFYRLLTFITGISWSYESWKEIGLKGLLEKSDTVFLRETEGERWWDRTLSLPNIPNLVWMDTDAKAISVNIGLSDKVVELVENGSWDEILDYSKEGIYLESFFKQSEQKKKNEIIWKNMYKDGMAAIVRLVYD
jgi:hypothetical protein